MIQIKGHLYLMPGFTSKITLKKIEDILMPSESGVWKFSHLKKKTD